MKVAVFGAGTMGNGIAQVFAQHGHSVVLRDLDRDILERARAQIEKSLARLAEKGRIPPGGKDAALARITLTTEPEALAGCDLVWKRSSRAWA
jgi:3-hydroxybutyryl-CoA dehydrogenase